MSSEMIDMSRLVGFDQLTPLDQQSEVDFQDQSFGAKLGAKRADVEVTSPASAKP